MIVQSWDEVLNTWYSNPAPPTKRRSRDCNYAVTHATTWLWEEVISCLTTVALLSDTAPINAVTSGNHQVSSVARVTKLYLARISGSDLQQWHKLSEEDHNLCFNRLPTVTRFRHDGRGWMLTPTVNELEMKQLTFWPQQHWLILNNSASPLQVSFSKSSIICIDNAVLLL